MVPVLADNMNSTNYRILFGNINIGGRESSSNNYTLDISLGQTVAQEFNSNGYVIKAGFQYIHDYAPFSFSLSDTSLNFGTLIPETPVTAGLTVLVTHPGQGYEVMVREDNPLRRITGSPDIADTQCNGGVSETCTMTSAKPWTQNSAYGFGYNASGTDVSADFTDNTYYRPFPSLEADNPAAVFMSSNVAVENSSATVTMKVNISSVQAAGNYQTVVNFLAVPKY